MKIDTFLQQVPSPIMERAQKILEKEEILDLHTKEGLIKAVVKGSYAPFYRVIVKIEDDDIKSWHCECPYDGEVCKHLVAVLLKAFSLWSPSKKRKKRKTKTELAEEILEKLSYEELKEFVRQGLRYSKELRNALLAKFAYYADLESKTLEAKYNAIFRHLLSSFKKRNYIDYYATIELQNEVEKLLLSAKDLIEAGKPEEAYAIAKSVLRGWVKNLGNMDDSSGATGVIIAEVLEIFQILYSRGQKDVLDYLLKEGTKKEYRDFDINYNIAKAMLEVIDSRDAAERLLAFVNDFKYAESIKAELLLKFFPESYEKFVKAHIHDVSVTDFHFKRLLERQAYEEALQFVEQLLSSAKINKTHLLEQKALILEKLNRKEEAIKIYYSFFTTYPSLDFLKKIKRLATPQEWEKFKKEAKALLKGEKLLTFLFEEKDFTEWLEVFRQEKEEIARSTYSFRSVVSMLKELPQEMVKEVARELLGVSYLILESDTPSRKLYREFIKTIDPLRSYLGNDVIAEYLEKVRQRYPARSALKDEIQKYLKKLEK